MENVLLNTSSTLKKRITTKKPLRNSNCNKDLILEAMENYYKKLYTSVNNTHDNDINDFIEHLEIPKLTDEERDSIEGPITLMECKTVLDIFQANKTPGEDGFTVEFYNFFYRTIGRRHGRQLQCCI